jgi:hypothetical protein
MAFWLSVTGWRFCVPGMLLLASIIYLLAIGDRSWFVGVAGTVFIFAVIWRSRFISYTTAPR